MIYAMPGQPGAKYTFKPRYDNFIGGQWVAPVKGAYFDVVTPISGANYTQAARSTAEDIELALDAAHAAFPAWGKTSASARANVLLQIADISDHFERVFHLKHLIRDLGADYEQARTSGESMRKQAYYDHLTGVYNRAMFMIQLRHDMKQADRNQKLVSVLFLDLDAFKEVNDTYGHAIGDLLLQQVAGRLKDCVRSSDTVARFGGDEFAIILTNIIEANNVREVAGKIRQALLAPYDLHGNSLTISASIGFCMYPADSPDPQALIDLADRAMYRVKFSGKNNVACYCDL